MTLSYSKRCVSQSLRKKRNHWNLAVGHDKLSLYILPSFSNSDFLIVEFGTWCVLPLVAWTFLPPFCSVKLSRMRQVTLACSTDDNMTLAEIPFSRRTSWKASRLQLPVASKWYRRFLHIYWRASYSCIRIIVSKSKTTEYNMFLLIFPRKFSNSGQTAAFSSSRFSNSMIM